MDKNEKLKFGKFGIKKCGEDHAKTWGELLKFEEGQNWLRWWSDTPSTGKFANYENKQKAEVKEWLGDPAQDTRGGSPAVSMAFVLSKLETIETLVNALVRKSGISLSDVAEANVSSAAEDVGQVEGNTTRVVWEE